MNIGRWIKTLLIILGFISGFWLISGRLLLELSWEKLSADIDPEGYVDQIKRDIALGNVGPAPLEFPCVTNLEYFDLKIKINGPMPLNIGGSITMSIWGNGQLYLGEPKRQLLIKNVPVCRDRIGEPDIDENAMWVYLAVTFNDLEALSEARFGGEQAFPVMLWKDVEIDLHPIPVSVYERGGASTQIVVRPVDPSAIIPDSLRYLYR